MADMRERIPGVRPARPGEVREYRVRAVNSVDPTVKPHVVRITVSAACPEQVSGRPCGMARGEPKWRMLFDFWTQTDYRISVPEQHPCGHTTLHAQLLAEADAQSGRLAS